MKSSRTATLWLQCMDMQVHPNGKLGSASPSCFRNASINNYTKSALIYLQQMSHLQHKYPDRCVPTISSRFACGGWSFFRSYHLAGVNEKYENKWWPHKRITEQHRLIWLLSMSACVEVNRAMLELTGVSYSTGEKDNLMTKAIEATW